MKIIIAGGMGYIGSALADLYAQRPEHEIILVDTNFVPERVAALAPNIRFIHGDAWDLGLMKPLIENADVLHILAAEVQAESSGERSEKVWLSNFELPSKLIEACPRSVRVMAASSGNVFGGSDPEGKFLDLTEEDPPQPKLPYAESKHALEQFLFKGSHENFTILRFGTNYGFTPGVRFNLVTNIFALRCLMGEDLTIHGTGDNIRPTCCTWDCARALMFTSEEKKARGELFHTVSASYKIRELAEKMIVFMGSKSKLNFVEKEVPFNSYALAADKIKKLGFSFEWDLKRAAEDFKLKLTRMSPAPDEQPVWRQ